MKKLLLTLVVSVSIFFLGQVPLAGATSIRQLGDIRFVGDPKPALGLTLEQVTKKYGAAQEVREDGCFIPLFKGAEQVGVASGTKLSYFHIQEDFYVDRNLCLVEGVVVHDALRFLTQEGTQIKSHTLEAIDPGLAADLALNNLDKKQKLDLLQEYDNPKIPRNKELGV